MKTRLWMSLALAATVAACGDEPAKKSVDTTLPDEQVAAQTTEDADSLDASEPNYDTEPTSNLGSERRRARSYEDEYDDSDYVFSPREREVEQEDVSSGPASAIPRGNVGNWVNTNDYPSAALQQEREGITTFTVAVGTDGRVEGCSVTGSSGHIDLDTATCTVVSRRARFQPATDDDGNTIRGEYTNRVRWQIPR